MFITMLAIFVAYNFLLTSLEVLREIMHAPFFPNYKRKNTYCTFKGVTNTKKKAIHIRIEICLK